MNLFYSYSMDGSWTRASRCQHVLHFVPFARCATFLGCCLMYRKTGFDLCQWSHRWCFSIRQGRRAGKIKWFSGFLGMRCFHQWTGLFWDFWFSVFCVLLKSITYNIYFKFLPVLNFCFINTNSTQILAFFLKIIPKILYSYKNLKNFSSEIFKPFIKKKTYLIIQNFLIFFKSCQTSFLKRWKLSFKIFKIVPKYWPFFQKRNVKSYIQNSILKIISIRKSSHKLYSHANR